MENLESCGGTIETAQHARVITRLAIRCLGTQATAAGREMIHAVWKRVPFGVPPIVALFRCCLSVRGEMLAT